MLSENIKNLRKAKGYSQEVLAERLNVVRQTVSKWENGLSVPDAKMLNRLAELFEVPLDTLVNGTIEEPEEKEDESAVAMQLKVLNEQLAADATRRKKIYRSLSVVAIILIVLGLLGSSTFFINSFNKENEDANEVLYTTRITVELNDKMSTYEVVANKQGTIKEAGGNAWFAENYLVEKYDNVYDLCKYLSQCTSEFGGHCYFSRSEASYHYANSSTNGSGVSHHSESGNHHK